MAAIPVTSDEVSTNPVQPLDTDQWADHERRLTILERSAYANLEARIAALEALHP